MRKFICTASIFAVIVAGLYESFVVKIHIPGDTGVDPPLFLLLALLVLACFVAWGLWNLASLICGALRKRFDSKEGAA